LVEAGVDIDFQLYSAALAVSIQLYRQQGVAIEKASWLVNLDRSFLFTLLEKLLPRKPSKS
jgi:hypothetical protein